MRLFDGYVDVAFDHTALDVDRTAHRVDYAHEFDQQGRPPVVFTIRPRCSKILGSTSSFRCVLRFL